MKPNFVFINSFKWKENIKISLHSISQFDVYLNNMETVQINFLLQGIHDLSQGHVLQNHVEKYIKRSIVFKNFHIFEKITCGNLRVYVKPYNFELYISIPNYRKS